MSDNFVYFAEDVLIRGAEIQRQFDCYAVDLQAVLESIRSEYNTQWLSEVIPYLEEKGFVQDQTTHSARAFRVNGSGFAAADRALEARKPLSTWQRLKRFDWSVVNAFTATISALAAVIAAIAACIAAYPVIEGWLK